MWMFLGTVAGLTFGVREASAVHHARHRAHRRGGGAPLRQRGRHRRAELRLPRVRRRVPARHLGRGRRVLHRHRGQLPAAPGAADPVRRDHRRGAARPQRLVPVQLHLPWPWIVLQAFSLLLFLGYTMSAASIERRVRRTPLFRGESMIMDKFTETGEQPRADAPAPARAAPGHYPVPWEMNYWSFTSSLIHALLSPVVRSRRPRSHGRRVIAGSFRRDCPQHPRRSPNATQMVHPPGRAGPGRRRARRVRPRGRRQPPRQAHHPPDQARHARHRADGRPWPAQPRRGVPELVRLRGPRQDLQERLGELGRAHRPLHQQPHVLQLLGRPRRLRQQDRGADRQRGGLRRRARPVLRAGTRCSRRSR